MGKEYRYRKHIYWGQHAIPAFFGLLFLLMLVVGILLAVRSGFAFIAIIFAIEGLVFLVAGGIPWYLYYRLAGISVSIDDDVLMYKSRDGEKRYPLETIYLEFASIKYLGGWLKIRTGKDTIRLTVVLEDISGLLQALKARLDSKQLSSHYDSHKLFGFLKTAAACDQGWERAYPILGKMFLLLLDIGIAIFTGFVFGTIPVYGLLFSFIWAGFSVLWIAMAYLIAEIILMRQIAKKSDENAFTFPPRDLPYEKLVFDRTFTWGSITYAALSLFMLVLVASAKTLFQF